MADYLDKYDKKNSEFQMLIESRKMTKEEYEKYEHWKRGQVHRRAYFQDMIDVLSEDTYNTNDIAAQMIHGHVPEVYAINANFAAYEMDKQIGYYTSYALYNREAVERLIRDNPDLLPKVKVNKRKDKAWNRKKFRNEITQGILQGESNQKIAKRLERVIGMNKNTAIRNARTATTSAQNAGKLDAYKHAENIGVDVWKVWIATMDGSTRHSHRALDGQERKIDEPFDSEHGNIMYPGDPYADPAELYNCRCRLSGLTKYSKFDAKDISKRFYRLPAGTTYEQWKQGAK